MGLARDFYVGNAIAISILLLILLTICGLKVGHFETSRHCSMTWSRPQYSEITELPNVSPSEIRSIYPSSYKMYRHHQSGHQFVERNSKLIASRINKVYIYIPGQSGSYLQIRSVASRILHQKYLFQSQSADDSSSHNQHHTNSLFLTFHFGEEWSSLSPNIITRQTAFVYMMLNEYLGHNLSLIPSSDPSTSDRVEHKVEIVFIGHSMGGIVTASLLQIVSKKPTSTTTLSLIDQYNANLLAATKAIVFISVPLSHPVLQFENEFVRFYKFHRFKLMQLIRNSDIRMLSVSGGVEDYLIESFLSRFPGTVSNDSLPQQLDFVVAPVCPSIMNSMGHQETVWCHGITERVANWILNDGHSDMVMDRENLYPFDPKLEVSPDSLAFPPSISNHQLKLHDITHSTVIVSCNNSWESLEICNNNVDDNIKCHILSGRARVIPSWISHSEGQRFHFSLNHEHHTMTPRFIAILGPSEFLQFESLEGHWIEIRGLNSVSTANVGCSLWQGPIEEMSNSLGQQHKVELHANRVYVDSMRLSPLMVHDITLKITPSLSSSSSSALSENEVFCVSGWSGMINAAGNGVYSRLNGDDENGNGDGAAVYEQESSFWFSPQLRMQSPKRLRIYRHPMERMWTFGYQHNGRNIEAFCDSERSPIETTQTPRDCAMWKILEYDLNASGYRAWRSRVTLSFSDECSPEDHSLVHLKLPQIRLFNEWVALSSSKPTIHRIMVPRVGWSLTESSSSSLLTENIDLNHSLQFEWYLLDGQSQANADDAFLVQMEYRYISSLINTMIRDYHSFPFLFVLSIWLAMIAEMFRVDGMEKMHFYAVILCVLMAVSCSGLLPINDHWRFVFLSYERGLIDIGNVDLYLLEFVLPFIYISSCIVLLHSVQKLVSILGVLIERLSKSVWTDIIPLRMMQNAVYVTVILYSVLCLASPEFHGNLKESTKMEFVEIEHILIGMLVLATALNRIGTISKCPYAFYEGLLCIVLIVSRWNIVFGILEVTQWIEIVMVTFCVAVISEFESDRLEVIKYSLHFHAKAMLSMGAQIYLMQKAARFTLPSGHMLVLSPLLQAMICFAGCKVFVHQTI